MPRRIKTPDGITHLFPDDATDQEISAALQVRTPAVSAFEMGRQSAAPDPSGGMSQWFEQNLRPLLAQVAHPKTIDDIASLLIPDAGLSATVRAGGRGTAAVGRGVERAATAPVVQRAADAMGTAGAAGEIFHGSPMAGAATAGAAIAAPRVAAAAGRGLQRAGNAIERAATEAPLAEQATSRVESVSGGRAPQGGPPPEPTPGARPRSPQQALNEEAIARRRSEYQAKQQAPPEAPKAEPTPAKPTMTAEESKAYLDLRQMGKTDQEALETLEAAKALNAKYDLKPPSVAEKKFPKGMRGKVSDKPPLTPEQQAAIQKNRQ